MTDAVPPDNATASLREMNAADTLHCEAWKLVIDFAKTLIGLVTAVLSALLGLILLGELEISILIICSLFLFGVSALLALYCFGRSISVIKAGAPTKGPSTIGYANASVFVLILGLLCLGFHKVEKTRDLNDCLRNIAAQTSTLNAVTNVSNVVSLKVTSDILDVEYSDGTAKCFVKYSLKHDKVIDLRK